RPPPRRRRWGRGHGARRRGVGAVRPRWGRHLGGCRRAAVERADGPPPGRRRPHNRRHVRPPARLGSGPRRPPGARRRPVLAPGRTGRARRHGPHRVAGVVAPDARRQPASRPARVGRRQPWPRTPNAALLPREHAVASARGFRGAARFPTVVAVDAARRPPGLPLADRVALALALGLVAIQAVGNTTTESVERARSFDVGALVLLAAACGFVVLGRRAPAVAASGVLLLTLAWYQI